MIGLGVGPGDEVLVPAHTYMATATAVLSVGAIPIIVDIDESLTISPAAIREAIGPRTKAVIPVHVWGAACDMDAIMQIAQENDLLVLEDSCQGVGGSYKGRKLGSIGHAGAFSFNYYKNITAGEGGGVASNDDAVMERARCAIDPCHFYWQGRSDSTKPFAGIGARASELMGRWHRSLSSVTMLWASTTMFQRCSCAISHASIRPAMPGQCRPSPMMPLCSRRVPMGIRFLPYSGVALGT